MAAKSPLCGILRTVFFVGAILFGTGTQAVITGGLGNDPIPDRDWPKGTLAIANHKSRLAWWEGPPFGGGEFTFAFRGDTAAFNEALDLLAKINWPDAELHVHAGPQDGFWLVDRGEKKEGEKRRDARIDWSFTVWSARNFYNLFNDPRSNFSSARPQFRQPLPAPKMDVYLGGGLIDWKGVKVPGKVRVVGSPERVIKREPPRIRLTVYDMQTRKPIQGATIQLIVSAIDGQNEANRQVSDAEGGAEFEKLEPGTYELRIEAEGFAPRSLGWEQYDVGDDKVVAATLSRAETLPGRVVNSQDQPVANASVLTFVVLGQDGRGYTLPERPETRTDDEGRFELKLPTGFVQLSAQANGLYHTWTDEIPVGDRRPAVDPGEPVQIRMVKTTSVTINLTDQAGKPISGQTVYLEPTGNPVGRWSGSATTDNKGTAVIQGVPPGDYQITDRQYPKKEGKPIRIDEGRESDIAVSW